MRGWTRVAATILLLTVACSGGNSAATRDRAVCKAFLDLSRLGRVPDPTAAAPLVSKIRTAGRKAHDRLGNIASQTEAVQGHFLLRIADFEFSARRCRDLGFPSAITGPG
jgi:hypothetical protein